MCIRDRPYSDYVERHIFAPAGMARSSFRQPLPASLRSMVASGYMLGSGKPSPFEMNSLAPSGGLTASGADMGRFMIAHLSDGGALMKPATAAQMHNTILRLIPPLNGMALGFYEQNINGRKALSHAGDSLNFHSQLWLFPEDKVGIYTVSYTHLDVYKRQSFLSNFTASFAVRLDRKDKCANMC